jgi:hypothetical protein
MSQDLEWYYLASVTLVAEGRRCSHLLINDGEAVEALQRKRVLLSILRGEKKLRAGLTRHGTFEH